MIPEYIEVIKGKNTKKVRLFLLNEMILDPRGESFKEMRNYAENEITDLYELDNGKSYSMDSNEWDKEFLYQMKNDLKSNFSRSRLDFYVKVAQFVLEEKAKNLDKEEEWEKRRTELIDSADDYAPRNKHAINKRAICKTVIVAGAATVVTGVVVAKTTIVALGVAASMTGVYLLKKEK